MLSTIVSLQLLVYIFLPERLKVKVHIYVFGGGIICYFHYFQNAQHSIPILETVILQCSQCSSFTFIVFQGCHSKSTFNVTPKPKPK